jgi:hypothetical protein
MWEGEEGRKDGGERSSTKEDGSSRHEMRRQRQIQTESDEDLTSLCRRMSQDRIG